MASLASSSASTAFLSPVVRTIKEFIIGAASFEEELQEIHKEIRYRDEILTINVKNGQHLKKQQMLIWQITKLECNMRELQLWEERMLVVQATLNSLQAQWLPMAHEFSLS